MYSPSMAVGVSILNRGAAMRESGAGMPRRIIVEKNSCNNHNIIYLSRLQERRRREQEGAQQSSLFDAILQTEISVEAPTTGG